MPEGGADTTTDFFFLERIETIQDDYPKDTLFPFLYRNTNSTCCTGTAALPNWILSRGR